MYCCYLIGVYLLIPKEFVIFNILMFITIRLSTPMPMHYKSPYRCFVATLTLFLSMFVVFHIHIAVCIIITILSVIIISGKANIKDSFMWQAKGQSKHQKEIDFVKYNLINPDLIAFENRLKSDGDNLAYMCYQYIFKDRKSWEETSILLQTETQRLTPIIDKIAFGLRISCKI